jgi:hypothetical protein
MCPPFSFCAQAIDTQKSQSLYNGWAMHAGQGAPGGLLDGSRPIQEMTVEVPSKRVVAPYFTNIYDE